MLRWTISVALSLVATGCSTTVQLGSVPARQADKVTVVDMRKPEQKVRFRESTLSPFVFYGDDSFQPPALAVFEAALASQPGVTFPLKVEVTEFRVIDHFPKRLSVGVSGPMASILKGLSGYSAEDWKVVENLSISPNTDGIICLVAASVNGKSLKAAAFEPYSISAAAISVTGSEGFRKSARLAIEKAAANLIAK